MNFSQQIDFISKVVPIGIRLFATEPLKVNSTPTPAAAQIPTAKNPGIIFFEIRNTTQQNKY